MKQSEPLVSIMIPNYNYGHFLRQCLDSAFEQTYNNIEVVLLDNCSQDNSLDIAKEYIPKGLRVCRNPFNIFSDSYKILSGYLIRGKYMMLLPSDDYISPTFIEKCVSVMEKHSNVGYVHVERNFVNEKGEITYYEEPFYNCSFTASGKDVLSVYMMTTVAHPAQALYRKECFDRVGGFFQFVEHSNADRSLWFWLSTITDYAYLREKLAYVRRGNYTETSIGVIDFAHPLNMSLTILDFIDIAKAKGYDRAISRATEAKQKFAIEILSHGVDMLLMENYIVAENYLIFCEIFYRGIVEHEDYKTIRSMIDKREIDREKLYKMKNRENHHRNYDPPENYEILKL